MLPQVSFLGLDLYYWMFDVGAIVSDPGSGPFQDLTFWILTAVAGVLCAVHIILSLKQLIKEKLDIDNSEMLS